MNKGEYENKIITAESAASMIKSGDCVAFTAGREASTIGLAIACRKEELQNVQILIPTPGNDFGWYDPGWDDSFKVTISMPTAVCQQMVDEKRCDIYTMGLIPAYGEVEKFSRADILLTEVSPPDEKGFCSFGASLWDKKEQVRSARLVIAETNDKLIRTYGDNFIHFSEIDYFVQHISSGGAPGKGSLAGRAVKEPEPYLKQIVANVAELIRDGDTIQIGVGRTTEPLVSLGLLKGKRDLGFHSEATPSGIISLVREGVINGANKTINTGKVVTTSIGGSTAEEMAWVNDNPLFHLMSVNYVVDIRTIATHNHMTVINNALGVDLSGQISSETLGTRSLAVAGGQISFVYGALLSQGGKSITVLPSTALGGKASRIVPTFEPGTCITLQRNADDYVVTEFGIAKLRGKTVREKAKELIQVAHPEFRAELKNAAADLYGL
jgi:4-hydroxybutyrate CoA-transferase